MTTYDIKTSPGKLSLTLPIKTISEANGREHRMAIADRKKEQRRAIRNWLGNIHRESLPAMPATVKLVRIAPKMLDAGDNLSSAFKAIRDEIAKAYGVDDGAMSPLEFDYDQEPSGCREYAVRIEIISSGVRA